MWKAHSPNYCNWKNQYKYYTGCDITANTEAAFNDSTKMRWKFNDHRGNSWFNVWIEPPFFTFFHCLLLFDRCSRMPTAGSNPTDACLSYILANLPKILSHYTLPEWLGQLPAGILSLISFQWNALKCRLTAFPFSRWSWVIYRCFKVFLKINVTVWTTFELGSATVWFLCNMHCDCCFILYSWQQPEI